MSFYCKILLRLLRKGYRIINPTTPNTHRNWALFPLKQYANDMILERLLSEKSLMVSRFGSTEMQCLVNYLGVTRPDLYKNIKTFIEGKSPAWWWEEISISQLCTYSGFFPKKGKMVERFCELTLQDAKEIDILGSWLVDEKILTSDLKRAKRVMLEDIEPFFCIKPWTWALEGKRVLVVHPFSETIESQYKKRQKLFTNNLLPHFELSTLKAVQGLAGEKTPFESWFDALEYMKSEISSRSFDICIIGCGAYGMPLAAHVKRLGKKSIHLGGVTQLLFGIMGGRWEEHVVYPYMNLLNDSWVRPNRRERPSNAEFIENACYW